MAGEENKGGFKMKKTQKEFDDLRKTVFKGSVAVKSTDLLKHARDPVALQGDLGGFVGIGIAGAMSEVASRPLEMIYSGGKRKKKKKKRR